MEFDQKDIVKEHVITDYLSVVLMDDGRVHVRVGDELVVQCRHALLTTTLDDDEIVSVDDIVNKSNQEVSSMKTTEEDEFFAHASNMQVWFEHDFDPFLCHSQIAFPILSELVDLGVEKAIKSFCNIVSERWELGNENSRRALLEIFTPSSETMNETYFHLLDANHDHAREMYDTFMKNFIMEFYNKDNIYITDFYTILVHEMIHENYMNEQLVMCDALLAEILEHKEHLNVMNVKTLCQTVMNFYYFKYHHDIATKLLVYENKNIELQAEFTRQGNSKSIVSDEIDYLPYLFSKGEFKKIEKGTWACRTAPRGATHYFSIGVTKYTETRAFEKALKRKFVSLRKRWKLWSDSELFERVMLRFNDGRYEEAIIYTR